MTLRTHALIAFVIASFAVGCGGGQTPAQAPAAESQPASANTAPEAPAKAASETEATASTPATTSGNTSAAKPDFSAMNREQRLDYMKTVVMPKERESFAAFDPKLYGNMKCPTCHGDGVANGTFKMPNPKLLKLSFSNDFKTHRDAQPAITKFMIEKVVPETAALLGMKPYDPQTHQGFGCGNCHVMGP